MDAENPMAGLLAQAQQMQAQLLAAQTAIAEAVLTGTAGGGLVSVTGTGSGDVTAITIDPKVIDPDDAETLQDLILGALADLNEQSSRLAQEKMGPLAGGLPTGFGL